MTIQDLVGTFSIVGSNQDATDNSDFKASIPVLFFADKRIKFSISF